MKHENMNEYALPFAAWDLRLYLDTHPDDDGALREYHRLCHASGNTCNYACNAVKHGGAVPYGMRVGDDRANVQRERGCGCGGGVNTRMPRGESGSQCGCESGKHHDGTRNAWSWIDGPWPWEFEANGGNC